MNTIDFEEYIQDNFNVSEPNDLGEHEKILVYERIKAEMLFKNYSSDDYTNYCLKLEDYLGV